MITDMWYRPLTAAPFRQNAAYQETEPCRILRPWVRCFWHGTGPAAGAEDASEIVIPDTCVDIIYRVDGACNIVSSDFVGINDRSFLAKGTTGHKRSLFAIRFYAWSACAFSEDSFAGTLNGCCDVRERFSWLDKELRRQLSEPKAPAEMIRLTEALLVKRLESARVNERVAAVMHDILKHQGAQEISRLSKENFISTRQLERLFSEYIGITPRKLSNLVRYQCLWRDIVSPGRFDIMDAVHQYGYTDAPHLMREFRRYHSMNIRAAKELALASVSGRPPVSSPAGA